MDGLLLVDKPSGMTSFDVVGRVRSVADMKKVGHMGTLDKAATGLLAVMLGKCTKLQRFLGSKVSRYDFQMRFGEQTDSLDRNGEVVAECSWEHVTADGIEEALGSFVGKIEQKPPKFSAVKIDGRRASDWARDDDAEEIEPEAREVEIRELELLNWEPPDADLRIECVSGTYVRSLVRDLAEVLDSCAFATEIRRTGTNEFHLSDAVPLSELDREALERHLLPPREMVRSLPAIEVDADGARAIGYGQQLSLDREAASDAGIEAGDWVAVVDPSDELAAVAECREGRPEEAYRLQPERVLKTSG